MRIIREAIDAYRDLVNLAQQKTDFIVRRCAEAILESNQAEEAFNVKIRNLEREMTRLGRDLYESIGMKREEFTLTKLADNLEQPLALEMKTQTTLFRNTVKQLKSIAQRNKSLIEKSIHYSQGLLNLISNATSSYQKTGLFKPVPAIPPTFSQRV
jgi:flagellar biosynthesis/type III secretory pathway chaperone